MKTFFGASLLLSFYAPALAEVIEPAVALIDLSEEDKELSKKSTLAEIEEMITGEKAAVRTEAGEDDSWKRRGTQLPQEMLERESKREVGQAA